MTIVIASAPIVRRDQRFKHLHPSFRHQPVRLKYKRELLLSQDPNADADWAWEQMYEGLVNSSESTMALKDNPADEWKQPAQQPMPLFDPVQQAQEFYNAELRSQMEALYDGQYIAIHPQTRSYTVERWPGKSFRALRAEHPVGPIIVHSIGFANFGLKSRLRGD